MKFSSTRFSNKPSKTSGNNMHKVKKGKATPVTGRGGS
jgi:hypothetical protein